jgi:hypothetical protein
MFRRALIVAGLFSTGCLMQTTTTEIQIADPSEVGLLAPDGPVLLEPSRVESSAPIASGRAPLEPNASASYAVTAERDDGGGISVDWKTSLPLANGDHHVLLASAPLVAHAPLDATVTPDMRVAPSLLLPACTAVVAHTFKSFSTTAVDTSITHDCRGIASVPMVLDIPWNDVAVVERTRAEHWGAWLVIGLATLSFGTFATFIFSTKPSAWTGGESTQVALGVGTAAIGAAFDLAMLPTLFARDRDVFLRR